MLGRSRAGSGPEELALAFGDRDVIDAGFPPTHQALIVELPEFIAVRRGNRIRSADPIGDQVGVARSLENGAQGAA